MYEKYETVSLIKLKNNEIIETDERKSEQKETYHLKLKEEHVLFDTLVTFSLGQGRNIQVRPSDILYIANQTTPISTN